MYLCVCVMFVASCLLTPWQDCFNLVYDCFKFETVLSVGLKLGYTLNPRVCHIGHFFIKWQSWGCTVYPFSDTQPHIIYCWLCIRYYLPSVI